MQVKVETQKMRQVFFNLFYFFDLAPNLKTSSSTISTKKDIRYRTPDIGYPLFAICYPHVANSRLVNPVNSAIPKPSHAESNFSEISNLVRI